jgi:hypothetical protein
MKTKTMALAATACLLFTSCAKENVIPAPSEIRNAGIQIDGNGKPASVAGEAGSCIDPNGKPGSILSESGTSLDPSGKPGAALTEGGSIIDPVGKPQNGPLGEYGIAIDPNGKKAGGKIGIKNSGVTIDPDGLPRL